MSDECDFLIFGGFSGLDDLSNKTSVLTLKLNDLD